MLHDQLCNYAMTYVIAINVTLVTHNHLEMSMTI